ncbi:MAG: PEP-CTERM sorting domain-containing protein [Trichodesmium sp. MAG_R03]|nr:PEP-CTERM sorting domain-containing protein [Trichodesmium sp. MAG_R03]
MKTKLSIFSLTITAALISNMPALAITLFSEQGISFDENTKVELEFMRSNGYWRAEFGVLNLTTNVKTMLLTEDLNKDPGISGNFGTPGIAVIDSIASYKFEANNDYTFFLDSYEDNTLKVSNYSTTDKNPDWYNSLTATGKGTRGDGYVEITNNTYKDSVNSTVVPGRQRALFLGNLSNGVEILLDDSTPWGENKFDAFVVVAKSVPEPGILPGLGLLAGGIFLSSSCKKQNKKR